MSLGIKLTTNGFDTLEGKLTDIGQQVKTFQTSEPLKIANEMVDKMQSICPVDTGFLRDNIGITNQDETTVQISSRAEYSKFVEFGTRYQKAQPFFFVVFDEYNAQNIASDFREEVDV